MPSSLFKEADKTNNNIIGWIKTEFCLQGNIIPYQLVSALLSVQCIYHTPYSLRVYTRKYLRRLRGPTCVAQLPMTIPGRTVPTRQSDTSLCCLYRIRCIIAYLNRREGKVRHRHFGGQTSRLPLRKYSRNRFLFGWS